MRALRQFIPVFLVAQIAAQAVQATPAAYQLQPDLSRVGFEMDFGPDLITGQMPVAKADLTVDFDQLSHCKFDVELNAASAQASFAFAEQALKGPKVLDVASYPAIRFKSSSVSADGDGAAVQGDVTIRGVTRPVTFHAVIWRQKGTVEGDRSRLTVRLTGAVNRSEFGADGWSDMVGDQVRLDILARIERVGG